MPTFKVDSRELQAGRVTIQGKEAHHLTRVLRVRPGDTIDLVDDRGHRFGGRIEAVGPRVTVAVTEPLSSLPPPYPIHLYQALIKGEALETIVEKSVELNIEAVHFIVTERSVIKDLSPAKLQRLGRIVQAAMKQSGRASPLRLEKPQGMEAALRAAGDQSHFIFLERREARTLKSLFASEKVPPPYGLWIGPEGGWTDHEVQTALVSNCRPATLGPLILRAPTAALHAISSLTALTE